MVRLALPSLVASAILMSAAPAEAQDTASKLQHYCTYWGSAGLYPDDEATMAQNPLAKLKVQLGDGTVFEFPLLYIFKGYELEDSPREWKEIWDGFAKVCPGWPKPQWLVKLEQWKAAQEPKENPAAAKRTATIKALLASAESKEIKAAELRAKIMTSKAYKEITGGRDDWYAVAEQQARMLSDIVSLSDTKYVLVGKVQRKVEDGVWVAGMAVAEKDGDAAPGQHVEPVQFYIQAPEKGWIRDGGVVFAEGAHLLGLPSAQSPQVVFGTSLPKATRAAVSNAKKELRTVERNLKRGKSKLEAMLRPADKLEAEAKNLREQAAKLQNQSAAQK